MILSHSLKRTNYDTNICVLQVSQDVPNIAPGWELFWENMNLDSGFVGPVGQMRMPPGAVIITEFIIPLKHQVALLWGSFRVEWCKGKRCVLPTSLGTITVAHEGGSQCAGGHTSRWLQALQSGCHTQWGKGHVGHPSWWGWVGGRAGGDFLGSDCYKWL